MKIHYNNGKTEKIIDNIIAINVYGNGYPVDICTKSGHEYTISLDNIEMIIDDNLTENKEAESGI